MKMNRFPWIVPALCCTVIFCMLFAAPVLAATDPALTCTPLNGSNVEGQDYSGYYYHSSPVQSYLTKKDGKYMRVQAGVKDSWLVISYYDEDFHLVERKEVAQELSIFGAFYETSGNYYIVSGQNNKAESNSVEVFRLTKYDKNWNRISYCSLSGANTYIPFVGGSCRMDVSGSYMIIRTGHEMYETPDGYHHQANVTIQVDIDQMKVTDSYTDISNLAYGYVSHSFNQFVKIENDKIVAVDHGDAHPRAICLMNYPTSITGGTFQSYNVSTKNVLEFPGEEGNNITGASVGGFEISGSSYLVAGNMVEMDDSFASYKTRNIFLASVDKSTKQVSLQKVTNYSEGETSTTTPHLVKIDGNQFFLIWSRGNEVSYVFLDGKGNKTSSIYTADGHLSDCSPMVDGNKILWYTWENGKEDFYQIPLQNPENLSVSETVYDHEYEYLKTENGLAYLKCKKCEENLTAKVPTFFNMWWRDKASGGKYSSLLPNPMDVGSTLEAWYTRFQYSAESDNILNEIVTELSDPDAGEITGNYDEPSILWKKTGDFQIKVYPKYNPDLVYVKNIRIVKPVESLSLSTDKNSPQNYGLPIKLIASPDGGKGRLTFRFSLTDENGQSKVLRDYATSNTFDWLPEKIGTYKIQADVKDAGDNDKVVSSKEITFEIKKGVPVLAVSTGILKSNQLEYGQKVAELPLVQEVIDQKAFRNQETGKYVAGQIIFDQADKVLSVGDHTITWTFVPDNENYEEVKGSSKIHVNKADPVVEETPVPESRTYHPKQTLADIKIEKGKVNVPGSWSWAEPDKVPTVDQKTYKAIFTPNDIDNYNKKELDLTLSLEKASPVLSDIKATAIIYGQTLADSTISAQAKVIGKEDVSVVGSLKWKEDATKPVVADSNTTEYGFIFTPEDQVNYKSVEGKISLTVNKAKAVLAEGVNVLKDNQLVYGQKVSELPLSQEVIDQKAFKDAENGKNLAGQIIFDQADQVLPVGNHTITWTFVPDNENYEEVKGSSKIYVDKADPVVEEAPVPESQTYHPKQTLADIKIENGKVNVPGSWSWTEPDKVPTVDQQTYKAIFTPDDIDNYNKKELDLALSVEKASPVLSDIKATTITYGQTLAASTISAQAKVTGKEEISVAGSLKWKEDMTRPIVADSNKTEYGFIFTPEDQVNYKSVEGKTSLTVNKAKAPESFPDGQMEVLYSVKQTNDELLESYPGWTFGAPIDLVVGDNKVIAHYTAEDADNYEITETEITITRKDCKHENKEVRDQKTPTCEEGGYSGDTYCSDCNEKLEEGEEIKALGHAYDGVWKYADKNYHSQVCAHDASHVKTEAHSWDAGNVTKTPTTSTTGIRTFTCKVCGGKKTTSIPALSSDKPTEMEAAPTLESVEKTIGKLADNGEPKGSSFCLLQARAKKIGKTNITLGWTGVKGAKSYIIYGNRCGKAYKYKKIATVSANKHSLVLKNLGTKKTKIKAGTFYKFIIVATGQSSNAINKAIATSKSIHLITLGNKKICNFKSVKLTSKRKLVLRRGKTSQIKTRQVKAYTRLKVSQHRKLSYESSNPKVATVTRKGKIKAIAKGKTKIYVYAQNGIFKVVSVEVR